MWWVYFESRISLLFDRDPSIIFETFKLGLKHFLFFSITIITNFNFSFNLTKSYVLEFLLLWLSFLPPFLRRLSTSLDSSILLETVNHHLFLHFLAVYNWLRSNSRHWIFLQIASSTIATQHYLTLILDHLNHFCLLSVIRIFQIFIVCLLFNVDISLSVIIERTCILESYSRQRCLITQV